MIEVSSLDDEVRELLGERVDGELSDFELIQVGKAVAPTKNRSLGEF
ncbi:zf-HC2 domain-containing protein [Halococcoides cellulosivorans]|nr:zf-HC2 domain-containing protein [Halococcoides cellulosivorans]